MGDSRDYLTRREVDAIEEAAANSSTPRRSAAAIETITWQRLDELPYGLMVHFPGGS